jgi:hypothetical protein
VPFVKAIVPVVDKEQRRIEIVPPEGLLELNAPKNKDEKDSKNEVRIRANLLLGNNLGDLNVGSIFWVVLQIKLVTIWEQVIEYIELGRLREGSFVVSPRMKVGQAASELAVHVLLSMLDNPSKMKSLSRKKILIDECIQNDSARFSVFNRTFHLGLDVIDEGLGFFFA